MRVSKEKKASPIGSHSSTKNGRGKDLAHPGAARGTDDADRARCGHLAVARAWGVRAKLGVVEDAVRVEGHEARGGKSVADVERRKLLTICFVEGAREEHAIACGARQLGAAALEDVFFS